MSNRIFGLSACLLLLASSCLFSQQTAAADLLYLNNGSVIHGTIIKSTDNYVTIETDIGQRLDVSRQDIKEIRKEATAATSGGNTGLDVTQTIRTSSTETIRLRDGSVVRGMIVDQSAEAVTLMTEFGNLVIPKAKILVVQYGEQSDTSVYRETTRNLEISKPTIKSFPTQRKLSLNIIDGPTFVLGPIIDREVAPFGMEIMLQLSYRLHKNISVVPIIISYTRFSLNYTKVNRYLETTNTSFNYNYKALSLKKYSSAFTPAIEFNTSKENKPVGIFQIGGGFSHINTNIKGERAASSPIGTEFNFKYSDDRLSVFLGAGIEGKIKERLTLVGMIRYWIIFHADEQLESFGLNPENTNGISFNGGIKLNF